MISNSPIIPTQTFIVKRLWLHTCSPWILIRPTYALVQVQNTFQCKNPLIDKKNPRWKLRHQRTNVTRCVYNRHSTMSILFGRNRGLRVLLQHAHDAQARHIQVTCNYYSLVPLNFCSTAYFTVDVFPADVATYLKSSHLTQSACAFVQTMDDLAGVCLNNVLRICVPWLVLFYPRHHKRNAFPPILY